MDLMSEAWRTVTNYIDRKVDAMWNQLLRLNVDLESSSLTDNISDHYMMDSICPTEVDDTVSTAQVISRRYPTQLIYSNLESKAAGNYGSYFHCTIINFTDDTDHEEASLRPVMDEFKSTYIQETRYCILSHDHFCIRILNFANEALKTSSRYSSRYSLLLIISGLKLPEKKKKKRNSSKQCHRNFSSCTCGKCSIMAVFEHTCPRAYSALIPHLHGTTLMSYYTSGFLLVPADNFWRVRNLPVLGGRGLAPSLPLESQHSSIATCNEILLMDTQTRKYAKDDHAVEDIPNIELHFSSLQIKINNHSTFGCTKQKDTTDICDPHDLANLALLLLLIAGDVEVNPGPQSGMFIKISKLLSV